MKNRLSSDLLEEVQKIRLFTLITIGVFILTLIVASLIEPAERETVVIPQFQHRLQPFQLDNQFDTADLDSSLENLKRLRERLGIE